MPPSSDASLEFVCPICGADPQEPCETHGGTRRFESHVERWNIVKDHMNKVNRDPMEGLVERAEEMARRAWQMRTPK